MHQENIFAALKVSHSKMFTAPAEKTS